MQSEFRFAFFDVDDTLIRIKSMFDFYRYWCHQVLQRPELHDIFEENFAHMRAVGRSREELNRAYYRYFAGVEPEIIYRAGAGWAAAHLECAEDFFVASVLAELQRLQDLGVVPVFVSGSFAALLEPIALWLGVPHIITTQLKVGVDGLYTGEIAPPQTIGMGKALAVQEFLRRQSTSPSSCYAFGDDISDLPMLDVVGHPVAVGTGTSLALHAAEVSWPVIVTSSVS